MLAVMYGAGNIGRGFIGQLFCESGYETVFIDINDEVVSLLNREGQYPIRIVSNEGCREIVVGNLKAINGMKSEDVAEAIAESDIMCTAVGVNVLPRIVPNIAKGIFKRYERGKQPLDIIICENLIGADRYLRELVKAELGAPYHSYLENCIGFVEASVGRMVPIMTGEMKGDNPLRVWVEPFCTLPVDRDAFKSDIPDIRNMVPSSPFEYHIQSKLYLHNMGHSLAAYLGYLKGMNFIWEAMDNDEIRSKCRQAMTASAKALSIEHSVDFKQVENYAEDLISRFGNRYLGDTVARVGKDTRRKLAGNDRLAGAALLCKKHAIDNTPILEGIAAALHFDSDDDGTRELLREIRQKGVEAVLTGLCGFEKNSDEYEKIIRLYDHFKL
jgi:mannitol-1-phosphate 5-dehydrogenase